MGIPLAGLSTVDPQAHAAALLDANLVLATHPHGAAFCRDAAVGEVSLRYAYPLDGGGGAQCLAQMRCLVAFLRDGAERALPASGPVSVPLAMLD